MPIRRYGNDVTALPSILKVHDPSAVPPIGPFQMKHSSPASWREEKATRNSSPVWRMRTSDRTPGTVFQAWSRTATTMRLATSMPPSRRYRRPPAANSALRSPARTPQGVLRGLVGPAEDPVSGWQLSRLPSAHIRRHRHPLAGPVTPSRRAM